jgi:hypothetical protein
MIYQVGARDEPWYCQVGASISASLKLDIDLNLVLQGLTSVPVPINNQQLSVLSFY